jgi:hypothetical protein
MTPGPSDLVHVGREVVVLLPLTPLELLVPLLQPDATRAQVTPARNTHMGR